MSAREEFTDIEERQPTEALAALDRTRALVVADQVSLTVANENLIGIKTLRRKFDDEFNPGIAQAFAHHRYLVAQKKKWTDPLDEAERALKPKIADYLAEQDRIRLEAERAAQRAKEAAAKEAEDTADVAHELIKEGKLDEAEQVVEMQAEKIESIQAAAPPIPEKAVAPGTTLKTTWEFEIENEKAIPREFLTPDLKKIRSYVTAMKHQALIPGVHIFPKQTVSVKVG